MPYEWITPPPEGSHAALDLWPYRSLPKRGFVVFIGVTAGMVAVPLLSFIGSAALWGVLPFILLTLAAVWWALQRSYQDGSVLEQLRLGADQMTLTRHNPRGPAQSWSANPHWVKVVLHPHDGPVEAYLTLTGGPREVEIGAFLTPEERRILHGELRDRLKAAR
jgi:uncharacterized membrane protein